MLYPQIYLPLGFLAAETLFCCSQLFVVNLLYVQFFVLMQPNKGEYSDTCGMQLELNIFKLFFVHIVYVV